jgi:hypothetical protein
MAGEQEITFDLLLRLSGSLMHSPSPAAFWIHPLNESFASSISKKPGADANHTWHCTMALLLPGLYSTLVVHCMVPDELFFSAVCSSFSGHIDPF